MRGAATLLALFVTGLAALAAADQCVVVESRVGATAALAIVASHGRVLEHCAPCGDPPPSLAAAVTPGRVEHGGDAVTIDGRDRDLAYLYLEVAPLVFENVALRSGCAATDVPEVWDFTSGRPAQRGFGAPSARLRPFGWGGPAAAFGRGRRATPPG